MIKKVNLEDKYNQIPEQKQELIIQKKMAQYTLQYLDDKEDKDWLENERLKNLYTKLNIDLKALAQELDETKESDGLLKHYQEVYLEILEHQRKKLNEINLRTEFDEELIRKYLALIDLEEFRLRERIVQEEIVTVKP